MGINRSFFLLSACTELSNVNKPYSVRRTHFFGIARSGFTDERLLLHGFDGCWRSGPDRGEMASSKIPDLSFSANAILNFLLWAVLVSSSFKKAQQWSFFSVLPASYFRSWISRWIFLLYIFAWNKSYMKLKNKQLLFQTCFDITIILESVCWKLETSHLIYKVIFNVSTFTRQLKVWEKNWWSKKCSSDNFLQK